MTERASNLVTQFLPQLKAAAVGGPIIDLACGRGRNGLALLAGGVDVVFADKNVDSLESIQRHLQSAQFIDQAPEGVGTASFWSVDLEVPESSPLLGRSFGGAVVFRYLHRSLFEHLRNAIVPGGVVIYETFTVDQPQYGRPTNPDFLLRHGELSSVFAGWDSLFNAEGVEASGEGDSQRAIASIVARKPHQ